MSETYLRPHKPNWGKSFSLFWKHIWLILPGTIRFVFLHPLMCWPVLIARLQCVYKEPKSVMTPEGFTLTRYEQHYVYEQIFVQRALAHPRLVQAIREEVAPLVVDVGANCGLFAQWVSRLNPEASFICCEPSEEYQRQLIRISLESPFNLSALVTCAMGEVRSRGHWLHGSMTQNPIGQPVKIETVDNLNSKPFLIKIDTDGSNLAVLKGARRTLGHTRFVLIEKENVDYSPFFHGWLVYELTDDLLYENPRYV